MNILVADDSSAMRMMIVRGLRQAGFDGLNIEQAEDGAQALSMVRENKPDLILSDWNMPNMNGMEFLLALKADEIDVIFGFITTESTKEMRQKAADAGAKFLIAKPFTVESFQKLLSAFMK